MQSLCKLRGVVQHYSWGGTSFIPDLIGRENRENEPFAEYWLGAHPKAPAQLANDEPSNLHQAIAAAPEALLGATVAAAFGSLPYLLKILDVRQMLSIQVHPSKASAAEGYKAENWSGIPLSAPHRNYKDENHKPELAAALSDFWLLHGFKNEQKINAVFEKVPAFHFLQPIFVEKGYKGLYEAVMTMPQEDVDRVLRPLMERIVPRYEAGELEKHDEHFWAARAVKTFCTNGHYDRGIFSVYFFNLLHLREGEAIYQPEGLPHAYLEGQNVEVMANSDNVLRAGLTEKHIDVAELMKHVKFEPTEPAVIAAKTGNQQVYTTPAAEFELTKLTLSDAAFFHAASAVILFVYEGKIAVSTDDKRLLIKRGEAAFISAGQSFTLKPEDGVATAFACTAPVGKK